MYLLVLSPVPFAMFLMPNSKSVLVAAMTFWLLDAGLNSSMEPYRAFVGDMLNSKQTGHRLCVAVFYD